MLLFLWLARLRERWLGTFLGRSRKRHRPVTRQRLYRRLEVEPLENRIVPSITLQNQFTGISEGSGGATSLYPDSQGAAGPTNYVETTNQEIALYNKSTGAVLKSDSLADFWYTQGGLKQPDAGSSLQHPVVTWDSQTQRFIVGDQDEDPNTHVSTFDIAVSKSASPATLTSTDWNFFQVTTTEAGYNADFPGTVFPSSLGWNHDSLVFTLNMVPTAIGASHVQINTIDMNALTSGTPLKENSNAYQYDYNSGTNLQPIVMQDSKAGAPMWFVQEGGDNKSVNVVEMSGGLSTAPSITPTNLGVTPYSKAVAALQPDGTAITSNINSRFMNAAMDNGLIVTAQQVSNAAGDRDMIQWYVIDTSSGTPALQQQGDIDGGAGTYYTYPGIDINSRGDIGLSYIASGKAAGQYMSMYVTGRTPLDPSGTMETPAVLAQAGSANFDSAQSQGELSGISVDSDGSFWAANEYATTNFGGSWGTAIAHFSLSTNVSIAAKAATAVYSPNAQTVGLSASVTDTSNPSTPVSAGNVTFTVLDSNNNVIGTATGTVSGGTANATFNLLKGQAAGIYTVDVHFSDSTGNFTDVSDTASTLKISAALADTKANNTTAYYSPNAQTVAVSAAVSDKSISTDQVGEGTVTFTIKSGAQIIGSAPGSVSGGTANANVSLPKGLVPGTYAIVVGYSDSPANFVDNGDTAGSLTLSAANVTTTANNASAPYSLNAQTVTLNAAIADNSIPTDAVGEGLVTFTVKDSKGNLIGTPQGTVANGKASAILDLNAKQAPGSYTIAVAYNDSPANNFTDNNAANPISTLTIGAANVATSAANASAVFSPNAQTVALNATVANVSIPGDTVNEGGVLFTIKDSGGNTIGTAKANVLSGAAATTFDLAKGQAAGLYTIAVSYSDSLGNFSDSADAAGKLTIAPANVKVAASNFSTVFSPNAQNLGLIAAVTDTSNSKDTVGEGTVTFTILSGATIIGTTTGTVAGGTANASFNWSGGRPAGSYTIAASYSDSAGNFTDDGKSDTTGTLTIGQGDADIRANNPTVFASSNPQTVALSASVTDDLDSTAIVKEGTVTFTVKSGGTAIGTGPVSASVVNGSASTNFTLPAAPGVGVGLYTIDVSYSDSAGNFTAYQITPGTLTVTPANVTAAANSVSTIYSPNKQSLGLSATVADASVPGSAVGEGTITFTITDSGGNTVGTAQGAVSAKGVASGGIANANFDLSGGQKAGIYTIAVSYSDGPGNFIDNGKSDTSGTLTIAPANVTASANNVSAFYSPNKQTLTLSAGVVDTSNSADIVGEGTVTFTVKDSGGNTIGTASGTVIGGTATANNFTLPKGQALGSYTIGVSYSDSAGNFIDNGKADASGTLTVAAAQVTTAANNVTVFYSPNSQTLNLSANVADTSNTNDKVSEGTVTFTVSNGLTVIGTASGTVTGGTANASFNLPAGQAASGALNSYTIAVSYSDSPANNFIDIGDTSGTLTIKAANVTTTASNVTAFYSPNKQTLALSASVADASVSTDTVSEGIVLFTVQSGSTTIGTTSGTVSKGTANANFNLPAGQNLGSYTITVSYSDSAKNFTDSGDNNGTLTVQAANVTTSAVSASTAYSVNAQTLALSANVTDASVPSDTVGEGIVSFSIMTEGQDPILLGNVQGTVTGGTANANFNLPAGLSAGTYVIYVSYSDSSGRFIDFGTGSGTLTVTPALVTTTAAAANATFSTAAQNVTLSANVANVSNANNAVGEGAVTFTVISSNGTVVGSVQGAVGGGAAQANFTLPAGLIAGNYVIAVGYRDSLGNFSDRGDTNALLTVGTAATNTQLTSASIAPNYSNLTVTETLTAHVGGSTAVNRGTVSFALANQTLTANVDGNGNATVSLVLPMLNLLSPQTINVNYADAGHNLTASGSAQTAAWQLGNPLVPTSTTFTAKGEVVTMDLFGLLISFTNGVLTEIEFGSFDLVFSYTASGQLAQATLDGINLLP